jgi:hypothetical protein
MTSAPDSLVWVPLWLLLGLEVAVWSTGALLLLARVGEMAARLEMRQGVRLVEWPRLARRSSTTN